MTPAMCLGHFHVMGESGVPAGGTWASSNLPRSARRSARAGNPPSPAARRPRL